MRKLLPFLLLNIIVSAATVLLVLFIWDAAHNQADVPSSTILTPIGSSAQKDLPPPVISVDQKTFEIQAVVGAGDLNLEHIQLISVANQEISLEGWKISDQKGNEFIFPSVKLYPGGGLNLFSRSGINTSVEIFWGRSEPAWKSGKTAVLLDPDGNIRFSYQIP